MKKLFLLLSLLVSIASYGQSLADLTGHYISMDRELLTMKWDGTFLRTDGANVVTGTFEVTENVITVTKPKDQYKLYYVINETTLVITKPRSNQAWVFRKISNEL